MAFIPLSSVRGSKSSATTAPPTAATPAPQTVNKSDDESYDAAGVTGDQVVGKQTGAEGSASTYKRDDAPASGGSKRGFIPLDAHQSSRKSSRAETEAAAAKRQADLEARYDHTDSGVLGIADTLSAGFSDEIAGGIEGLRRGVMDPWNFSQRFGEGYEEFRDIGRQVHEDAREANPNTYMGGQVVGGVLSLPMGGVGVKAGATAVKAVPTMLRGADVAVDAANAGRAASTAGRAANAGRATAKSVDPIRAYETLSTTGKVWKGAKTGAGFGGLYGYGSGEGLEDSLSNGLSGAVAGGVTGGAFGVVGPAAAGILRGTGNAVKGAGRWAGEGLGVVAKRSPDDVARMKAERAILDALTKDEVAAAQSATVAAARTNADDVAGAAARGQPLNVGDLGGAAMSRLARKAAAASPTASDVIVEGVASRATAQPGRINSILNKVYGGDGSLDTNALSEGLKSAYRQSTKPQYDRAMNDPAGATLWTSRLDELSQSPTFQKAVFNAERRSRDLAATEGARVVKNPFTRHTDGRLVLNNAETGATPSLAFWDIVKRNLDSEVTKIAGKDPARSREIGMLRDELKGHLDELVPTYQYARGQAAAFFRASDALEAGQKFARDNSAQNLSAVAELVSKQMGKQEREIFERGLVSEVANKAFSKTEGSDLTKTLFNGATMNKLRAVMSPQRISELENSLRVERLMRRMNSDAGAAPSAADRMGELLSAGIDVASSGFSVRSIAMQALRFGSRKLGAGMSEEEANAIAKQLTNADPKEIQRLLNRRAGTGADAPTLLTVMEYGAQKTLPPSAIAVRSDRVEDTAEAYAPTGDNAYAAGGRVSDDESGNAVAKGLRVADKIGIELRALAEKRAEKNGTSVEAEVAKIVAAHSDSREGAVDMLRQAAARQIGEVGFADGGSVGYGIIGRDSQFGEDHLTGAMQPYDYEIRALEMSSQNSPAMLDLLERLKASGGVGLVQSGSSPTQVGSGSYGPGAVGEGDGLVTIGAPPDLPKGYRDGGLVTKGNEMPGNARGGEPAVSRGRGPSGGSALYSHGEGKGSTGAPTGSESPVSFDSTSKPKAMKRVSANTRRQSSTVSPSRSRSHPERLRSEQAQAAQGMSPDMRRAFWTQLQSAVTSRWGAKGIEVPEGMFPVWEDDPTDPMAMMPMDDSPMAAEGALTMALAETAPKLEEPEVRLDEPGIEPMPVDGGDSVEVAKIAKRAGKRKTGAATLFGRDADYNEKSKF